MHRLKEELRSRKPFWVRPGDSVRDVVRYMCSCRVGAVLVNDGDEAVGIFSERDLMRRVVGEGLDPDETAVREVMSYNVIKMHINEDIRMAKALMRMNQVRHLLVLGDDGHILGLVSMRDLVERDLDNTSDIMHKLNDAYYDSSYKAKWRKSSNRVIIEPYHVETELAASALDE